MVWQLWLCASLLVVPQGPLLLHVPATSALPLNQDMAWLRIGESPWRSSRRPMRA